MTESTFKYMDPTSYTDSTIPFIKPWAKVDTDGQSFTYTTTPASVSNMRGRLHEFGTDISGFEVHNSPATEKLFTDDAKVRSDYYPEVEALLREKLPKVKKVVMFDHTIRRQNKASPRQPVQQVHVDQTPGAAEVRLRRHLPAEEAEELLKGRYQIINVWRPIENPASDFPLAVVDWRSTSPEDFVKVDLLYPKRDSVMDGDDDDRGKEVLADPSTKLSTEGYQVKGETYGVQPNAKHRFWYNKDMTPEEVMFIKCFDSRADGFPGGVEGRARCTPHTAFVDPNTPKEAPGRQSIEVRCLVFYDD